MKRNIIKIITAIFVMTVVIAGLSACGTQNNNDNNNEYFGETRTVVDVWGREVEIPSEVNTIIAIGPGAPRIAAYLDVMDMLVGAEGYLTDEINVLRDYNPVHHAMLRELPVVATGRGSGENNGFPEEIIRVAPDVIIAGVDLEAADELQMQTGIPVVSVRHITGLATECFRTAVQLFAEVVGVQNRADEILSYIDNIKADLYNRTAGISEDEKLRAYAGAVTWNGRRGFAGTYSVFGIFDAIGAVNVAHVPGITGFFEASFESILIWDPDIIFLDPGNMDLVNTEYATNPNFFYSLRAVQNGQVYAMPSFNNAGTNITYALINAYNAGIVLFPEQFADVDISEKAGEILTMLLGKNTFELMADGGLVFGRLTIGE